MPARVIRGEINASESLSRVSIGADLTFRALLVAVDDYGRMDARPSMLRAALFPVRTSVNEEQIQRWIDELRSPLAGEPLQLYEVDGRPYLQLTAWEKHRGKGRRAETSRFPDPPPVGEPPQSEAESPILEIPGDPRIPEISREIRPSDVGRGTRDEGSERPRKDAKIARALNILSKEPGTDAEKQAFLEADLERIEDEAQAAFPKSTPTKQALNAKIRSLIVGWYRQRRRNPAGPAPRGTDPRGDGTDGSAQARRDYERTQEKLRQIKDTSPEGDTVGDLIGGIGREMP